MRDPVLMSEHARQLLVEMVREDAGRIIDTNV